MTLEEMRKLKPGDAIRHKGDANGYIVTANYLSRVTAVRTADITNPAEWDLAPQPNKIEEKINWIPAGVKLPDAETTVLVIVSNENEPCWPAYISENDQWFYADGTPIVNDSPVYWAHMPGGPFSDPIIDDLSQ
jgi:hypothetical protein